MTKNTAPNSPRIIFQCKLFHSSAVKSIYHRVTHRSGCVVTWKAVDRSAARRDVVALCLCHVYCVTLMVTPSWHRLDVLDQGLNVFRTHDVSNPSKVTMDWVTVGWKARETYQSELGNVFGSLGRPLHAAVARYCWENKHVIAQKFGVEPYCSWIIARTQWIVCASYTIALIRSYCNNIKNK